MAHGSKHLAAKWTPHIKELLHHFRVLSSHGLDDLDGVTRLVNFFTVLRAGCMSVPTNFPSTKCRFIRADKFIQQKASSDHQTKER